MKMRYVELNPNRHYNYNDPLPIAGGIVDTAGDGVAIRRNPYVPDNDKEIFLASSEAFPYVAYYQVEFSVESMQAHHPIGVVLELNGIELEYSRTFGYNQVSGAMTIGAINPGIHHVLKLKYVSPRPAQLTAGAVITMEIKQLS